MNNDVERECVKRLQRDVGVAEGSFRLESRQPPEPDIQLMSADGTVEAFEVTEIHPDEQQDHGSVLRAVEEAHARQDPSAIHSYWVLPDATPAIVHRVREKIRKAPNYVLGNAEPLTLLLVGALASHGAVAATGVVPWFVDVALLSRELDSELAGSRFQRMYLHLQLYHAVWEWSRPHGWRVLRQPTTARSDGLEMLDMLRGLAGNRSILPGTRIVARWP